MFYKELGVKRTSLGRNQNGSIALIIILVAVAIIVVGGAVYVFTRNSGDDKNSTATQTSGEESAASSNKSDDVKTLIADSKAGKYDVKCTYQKDENAGTFYFRGTAKFRFDLTAPQAGHAIKQGDKLYTWNGDKGTVVTGSQASQSYSVDKYVDDSAAYHLQCQNVGHLQDSLFTPPSNVNYADLSEYTNRLSH